MKSLIKTVVVLGIGVSVGFVSASVIKDAQFINKGMSNGYATYSADSGEFVWFKVEPMITGTNTNISSPYIKLNTNKIVYGLVADK